MDGLLLDTERMAWRGLALAFERMGFEMSDALFLSLIGLPTDESTARVAAYCGPTFSEERYYTEVRRAMGEVRADGIPVKPGVVDLLGVLEEAGLPRAVATSTRREPAHRHLEDTGLKPRFQAIRTRDDVERGKPSPDLFLAAAEALGLDPSRCLALEDSHNGVRAAHAAGCDVIMVPDLLEPVDDITALCLAVHDDLHQVRVRFFG